MRIGINLLAFKEEKTGLLTYGENLLECIGKIENKEQLFLFINQKFPSNLIFNYKNFHYIKTPINSYHKVKRALWEQFIFPFYLKKYKIDILFNPTAFHPLFPLVKNITCVHSGGPLYFKLTSLSKLYLKFMYYTATKFSSQVITISNFAKKEILQKCKVPQKKIKVIHHGLPKLTMVDKKRQPIILTKFKIKTPYLFFIGGISQNKNIKNLVSAFKTLSKKYPNFNLVLSGKISPEFRDIKEFIKNSGLEKKIILTDIVDEEEKTTLYKNALALIFPSFHEGFGLPVLEAQSLGIPVLTSNVTALPEVAGEGALFVGPYNVGEIAQGMEKIAFDKKLREDLIKKGYENIKRFSWEKTARETLKVLKEAYYENSL